ncbi:uncharacterized protein LOC119445117 [Dermacentor silvarum]|uniref:uncharacterized protein LOC119445117 n=1 Tax=Dermacentor silvarum TaxID=543639 RepID=UPI002101B699|nr:uncharacterized protein LOC119445117 [Dermacentor silvarum]
MDEERAHGVVEGERYVELNIQQPQHAHFHQLPSTPMSVVEEQRKECRSLSHLGIFMPLYLLPLLFLGPKYGGCLYCLLLPLLLWAFNLLPKPATALVHLVTVPVLGLMDTEARRSTIPRSRRPDHGPAAIPGGGDGPLERRGAEHGAGNVRALRPASGTAVRRCVCLLVRVFVGLLECRRVGGAAVLPGPRGDHDVQGEHGPSTGRWRPLVTVPAQCK